MLIRTRCGGGHSGHWRHSRHGRHGGDVVVGRVGGVVLLCARRELRVRGMAEAHQAEAPGVGRVVVDGRRGRGVVIIIEAGRGPRNVRRGRAEGECFLCRLGPGRARL